MHEFADIDRRIERLSALAAHDRTEPWLLTEVGDVLACGYMSALNADARSRRLGERIDELLEKRDHRHVVDEARRLARERRSIDDATRRLRARLAVVRSLVSGSGSV